MKELKEIKVEIGFDRKPTAIADEIERWSQKLGGDGWAYTHNKTDELMRNVILYFEREFNHG